MLSIVHKVKARSVRETAKRILQRCRADFQERIMIGAMLQESGSRHRCADGLEEGSRCAAHGPRQGDGDSAVHARH